MVNLNDESSKRIIIYFIFFLVLFAIVLLIYAIIQIKTDGSKCMLSPLVYGVDKLSEINNADLSYTCTFSKEGTPIITVQKKELKVDFIGGSNQRINLMPNITINNNK